MEGQFGQNTRAPFSSPAFPRQPELPLSPLWFFFLFPSSTMHAVSKLPKTSDFQLNPTPNPPKCTP